MLSTRRISISKLKPLRMDSVDKDRDGQTLLQTSKSRGRGPGREWQAGQVLVKDGVLMQHRSHGLSSVVPQID